jgi:hypothetical protein
MSIIWKNGLLDLSLNANLYGQNLETLISSLYITYGFNAVWCNPEQNHPCLIFQQQMHEACRISSGANQIPFYFKNPIMSIGGQFVSPIVEYGSGCFDAKKAFEECMNLHLRAEFAQRWLENHPSQIKPLLTKPIVTWPHIK